MSTQFTNRQWRLPNNENKDKQSNYSMDFDGSEHIDIGNPTELQLTNNISVSGWFKTSSTSIMNIFTKRATGVNNWSVYMQSGSIYFWVSVDGSSVPVQIQSASTLNDGNWHFFAGVREGTSLKLYIDNLTPVSGTIASGSLTNPTGTVMIGKAAVNSFLFNGQIDGVAIFNYALSSSQITTLYGSSSTGIGNPMALSPAPVAYYPLGDQDSFNGSNYLVPNSSLKDFVFDFIPNDYIDCGNDSSLQITGNITLSTWVNIGTSTSTMRFINKDDGSNRAWIMLVVSGKIRFTRFYTASSFYYMDSSISVNDSNWHHIACVNDSAGTAKIYIDGSEDTATTGTNTGTLLNNASVSLKLGGDFSSQYLNGKLSNAQIFNTALPATGSNSVKTLYNNGSPLTSMSGFTSLQGWWKLDASDTYDSSTTTWTIADSSSNSNDGTSSGMTQANLVQSDLSFTSGYSPYALDFDGTNDYIGTTTGSITGNDARSMSFWYKTTSSSAMIPFSIGNPSSPGVANSQFGYCINNGSPTQAAVFAIATNDVTPITGVPATNDGNWHHVVVSWSGSVLSLYIDGTEYATPQPAGNYNTTAGFKMGGWGNNDRRFNGSISNCSVWNAALTSSQVSEIYNEGVPSNLNNHSAYLNLVSWWQLGSNSSFNTNWTVLDEKGSNNGTSSNMTEDDIVDGVGSYANGLSSGMGGDEVIGDAPYSSSNSLSVNMDVLDRVEDTPA